MVPAEGLRLPEIFPHFAGSEKPTTAALPMATFDPEEDQEFRLVVRSTRHAGGAKSVASFALFS